MARRELAIDTDVATFALAVLGLVFFAAMAAAGWFSVLKLQASPHRTTWMDYLAFFYAIWIFVACKGEPKVVRAVRFFLGLLLVVMAIPISVSLLHLSPQTAGLLSLWSTMTSALLSTAAALFLVAWFGKKFRDAS